MRLDLFSERPSIRGGPDGTRANRPADGRLGIVSASHLKAAKAGSAAFALDCGSLLPPFPAPAPPLVPASPPLVCARSRRADGCTAPAVLRAVRRDGRATGGCAGRPRPRAKTVPPPAGPRTVLGCGMRCRADRPRQSPTRLGLDRKPEREYCEITFSSSAMSAGGRGFHHFAVLREVSGWISSWCP
jgi:hypothetical protein